jgi:hypothetical protein
MNGSEPPRFSVRVFAVWMALGLLGIALAVAIALVARNLADQPVGLAGEPVSAGRALDPAGGPADPAGSGRGSAGSGNSRGNGKKRDDDEASSSSDDRASDDSPGTVSPAAPGSGSGSGSGGSGGDTEDRGGEYEGDDD